tara:strand:+ start:1221 stop:1451 length:231 start_codon:yes stop_codon:yes gene_type:complete
VSRSGTHSPIQLVGVVSAERFDAVVEALEYDTDRIVEEIQQLSERRFALPPTIYPAVYLSWRRHHRLGISSSMTQP